MGYLIFMAVIALVTAIGFFVGMGMQGTVTGKDYNGNEVTQPKETNWVGTILKWSSLGIGILLFLVVTPLKMFHSVPAGHVGVVYQFGNIVDQTGAGLVTTMPWQNLKQANVQVQKTSFEKLDAFTEETQDVFIAATLNYQVSPNAIQDLYRNVGPNYFEKLVPNRLNQIFKDETVKYKAVQIAPAREKIRASVKNRLEAELKPFSIEITDLLIDNISFSPAFTKAIENKQIATQDAQTAQNRVKQAQYEADQLIQKAQGEAAAYRLRQKNLTPLLVQQNAIDKLNPNVDVIILPSGSNFLLPSELVTPRGR